ncbi:ribonuclease H-like domain-containing protein [Xylariales sp. PMI_506]|nr:ribonuclease H-like domain-containing protein [Xylariales sp. PMI_506]
MTTPALPYILADTTSAIVDMVKVIQSGTASGQSLFLDLEGVNLCRYGTISIVTIFIEAVNRVYLVDVHALGTMAFNTATDEATSLKTILESPSITKVFFDVRNDSDAMHHHFGICLAGAEDVQLMELASRPVGNKRFLSGLEKCIDRYASLSYTDKRKWSATKDNGLRLFHPSRGGTYEVFNTRPMDPDVALYCINDVLYLPQLRTALWNRVSAAWRVKVEEETLKRVMISQSPSYQPQSDDKKFGPWKGYI